MTALLALLLIAQPGWISAAIAEGAKTRRYMAVEVAVPQFGPQFGVYLRGPYARVASASARQAQKYLTLNRDDVTDEMISPLLEVSIVPADPIPGQIHWLPEHVVIKHANGRVFQPVRMEREETSWGNAFGGTWNGHTLIAWFDYAAIPPGDIDVVTISGNREVEANIKARNRRLIR